MPHATFAPQHERRPGNIGGPVSHLELTILDGHGNLCEQRVLPTEEAIAYAADFIRAHGTDPELDGQDAMAGTVQFAPAKAPAAKAPAANAPLSS